RRRRPNTTRLGHSRSERHRLVPGLQEGPPARYWHQVPSRAARLLGRGELSELDLVACAETSMSATATEPKLHFWQRTRRQKPPPPLDATLIRHPLRWFKNKALIGVDGLALIHVGTLI